MDFYTAVVIVSFVSLLSLGSLVYDNSHFSTKIKSRFLTSFAMIFLAGFSEWLSFRLNGAPMRYALLHRFIKCADYVTTPLIANALILLVNDDERFNEGLFRLSFANAVIHVISIFTGWTFYIDAHNFHHHGPYYYIYIIYTIFLLVLVIYEFAKYSVNFKNHNRFSLIASLMPLYAGFFIQEAMNIEYRVLTISLVISAAMIYIHFSDFAFQKHDDKILNTRKLLDTDVMTGLNSRYSYSRVIKELSEAEELPEDLVIFSVDINGLKETNDALGHLAGDEIIIGCAECLKNTLGKYGSIFRVGGDEFIAILYLDFSMAADQFEKLKNCVAKWHGNKVDRLSLSAGFSGIYEHPYANINELLKIADKRMYEDKRAYYSSKQHDRRKR